MYVVDGRVGLNERKCDVAPVSAMSGVLRWATTVFGDNNGKLRFMRLCLRRGSFVPCGCFSGEELN